MIKPTLPSINMTVNTPIVKTVDKSVEPPILENGYDNAIVRRPVPRLNIIRRDELKTQVKEKIYTNILKEVYTDQIKRNDLSCIKDFFDGPEDTEILNQYMAIQQKKDQLAEKSNRNTIAFMIVLSPPHDIPDREQKIFTYCESLQTMSNIQNRHIYSIEWGKHDPPEHMHSNILYIKSSGTKNSNVINQLKNKYEKIFGIKSTPISLNVKYCNTTKSLTNCINYTIGNKCDPKKQEMVNKDRHLRNQLKIQQYYNNFIDEELADYKQFLPDL